jgi:hypothetical protein
LKATEAIGSKRPRRGATRAPVREETTPEEEDEIEDDDSVEMVEPPAKRKKAEAGPSRKGKERATAEAGPSRKGKERETAGSSGKEALEQALQMMERGADQVKAGAELLRMLLLGEPSAV